MKKTLFSFGIYKESMRRLRVIGFIALVFLLVVQMSPVIIGVVDYAMMGKTSQAPTAENFATLTWAMATVSTLVAPLMVLIAFSIFNKRASSDFYHALPYTRPCVFVSIMAAVYTWTAIISIVRGCSCRGRHPA